MTQEAVAEVDAAEEVVEQSGEELEIEVDEAAAEESGAEEAKTEGEEQAADTDEVTVTLGEESPPSEDDGFDGPAPQWVKDLRKEKREISRKLREAEHKLASLGKPGETPTTLGPKPKLADFDYDEEAYDKATEAWFEAKRADDERKREQERTEKEARDQWDARLAAYGKQKAALKVPDFDDAEEAAQAILSVPQQGIILSGAEHAAALLYALGRNPAKAKELASITDPVKFAFAVAKLETQMKVTTKRTAPAPERTVRGSITVASADRELERLRAEADKTGDRSKVVAYLRQRQAAKS